MNLKGQFRLRFPNEVSQSIRIHVIRDKFRLSWYLSLFLHQRVQSSLDVGPRKNILGSKGTLLVLIIYCHIPLVHILALDEPWGTGMDTSLSASAPFLWY